MARAFFLSMPGSQQQQAKQSEPARLASQQGG
jgi:hypothetical protein